MQNANVGALFKIYEEFQAKRALILAWGPVQWHRLLAHGDPLCEDHSAPFAVRHSAHLLVIRQAKKALDCTSIPTAMLKNKKQQQ